MAALQKLPSDTSRTEKSEFETSEKLLQFKNSCLQLAKKHQQQLSLALDQHLSELYEALEVVEERDGLVIVEELDFNEVGEPAVPAVDNGGSHTHASHAIAANVLQRQMSESSSLSLPRSSVSAERQVSCHSFKSRSSAGNSGTGVIAGKLHEMDVAGEAEVMKAASVRGRRRKAKRVSLSGIDSRLSLKKNHNSLDLVMGGVIALNAASMVISLEWEGTMQGKHLGIWTEHSWAGYGPVSEVLEHVFTAVYLVELLLRLYTDRMAYFKSAFNLFDCILVVFTTMELWILSPVLRSSQGSNSNSILTLRILRAVKLLRAARLIRAVRLFRGLRQLVTACASSVVALFWSMVLLMLCIVTAGLMIGNLMQEFIRDANHTYENRVWIWTHYGTAFQAFYTMFEITFAGNWPIYARPVLNAVSPGFAIFFCFYVAVVVFAVTRVIGAIFLKDALDATSSDPELKFHTKQSQAAKYMQKIAEFFTAIDTTHDGNITREELDAMLESSAVLAYLSVLDIEVHEAEPLFDMIDIDGSGTISYEEFVKGLLRFKGQARSLDLVELQVAMRNLQQRVDAMYGAVKGEWHRPAAII